MPWAAPLGRPFCVMIENSDDWAVLMDPEVFGEAMELRRAAGGDEIFNGLFTAAHAELAGGELSLTRPVVVIGPLPGGDPENGDVIEARGRDWRVVDVQPDGTGLVRAMLEEI